MFLQFKCNETKFYCSLHMYCIYIEYVNNNIWHLWDVFIKNYAAEFHENVQYQYEKIGILSSTNLISYKNNTRGRIISFWET